MDFGPQSQEQLLKVTRMKLEIDKNHFPMFDKIDRLGAEFNFPPNLIELTLTNFNFLKDIHLISAINK